MSEPQQGQTAEAKERKVGLFLAIGIVFVPYLFSWFTLRKGHSTASRVISLGWLGLILLLMVSGSGKGGASAAANKPLAVSEVLFHSRNKDTPCRPLADSFSTSAKRTELQMDESFKSLKDQLFQYDLRVKAVEVTFGSLSLQLACPEKKNILDSSDFILRADDDFKSALGQLSVDSMVRVCGRFTSYTRFTGLHGKLIALGECPNAKLKE